MMNTRAWVSFWLLGLIWGSSFLLIRIGVVEFRPVELVFIRTVIAAIGLGLVVYFRRVSFPTRWQTLRTLAVIGVGNVVAPFMLITWGEQTVPSGMAAVLQSTAALFSLVIAHFAFVDERMTPQKVAGLILGFVGVVVLFSGELTQEGAGAVGLLGHVAIVIASLCYAIFTSMGRKVIQGKVEPIVVAFSSMAVASIVTLPPAIFSSARAIMLPSSVPNLELYSRYVIATQPGFTSLSIISPRVLFAVVLLGVLNTFVAYLFYYFIVRELGAARAAMVTYVIPPVGVTLGALLLQETVGITLLAGAGLIFTGIAIVNLRWFRRPIPAEQARQSTA
jgi:drug/metabolite transporter (DMT)-like permease